MGGMTGRRGFQKSRFGKGNRHKRHTIVAPQDPREGPWLPDLEMKGFIKEMTFEAGFEERVEIVQVRRRLEREQALPASFPLGLPAPGSPCPPA